MTGILYEIIVFGELGLILGQFLHLIEKSAKTVVLMTWMIIYMHEKLDTAWLIGTNRA